MAHPHLVIVLLARHVDPALGEDQVGHRLVRLLGRLRRVQRGGPLQHVLLRVGREQPLVEGALDVQRVLLRRVRRLEALLDGDEAERLAEVGAVRVGEVHEDPVGEEHKPKVLELRAADAALLLEQPAVRDVGHLLLEHDDLLQPQVPLRELAVGRGLERKGLMDVLRNQIIERKTIDLVTSQAKFEDMPFEFPKPDAEAIDHAVCGVAAGEDEIPTTPLSHEDSSS